MDFTKNIFCVITGASRGIGRKIAEEVARKAPNVTFVLIARSEHDLQETEHLVKEVNQIAVVYRHCLDLSAPDAEAFRRVLSDAYGGHDAHNSAVIFHNAGQIGDIEPVAKLDDYGTWKKYYDLNLFSVTVLNACFLQTVRVESGVFVVNVTSLVGRQPFKYLSMYGSGKAARDLYFKVLALEEPHVKVLNYSPGMVETAMAGELVGNIGKYADSEISAAVKENPVKLTPEQTVLKLVSILEQGAFESGKIIDYYD